MAEIITGTVYGIREISSGNIIYVGSTQQKLKDRTYGHLSRCYGQRKNSDVYRYIRSIAKERQQFKEYFKAEPLYEGVFESKTALKTLEESFRRNTPTALNMVKAFQTEEEKQRWIKEYHMVYTHTDEYRKRHRENQKKLRAKRKNNAGMNV